MKKSEFKALIREALQEATLNEDYSANERDFKTKKEAINFAKNKLKDLRFSSGAGFERNPFAKLKTGEYFMQETPNNRWTVGWKQ